MLEKWSIFVTYLNMNPTRKISLAKKKNNSNIVIKNIAEELCSFFIGSLVSHGGRQSIGLVRMNCLYYLFHFFISYNNQYQLRIITYHTFAFATRKNNVKFHFLKDFKYKYIYFLICKLKTFSFARSFIVKTNADYRNSNK